MPTPRVVICDASWPQLALPTSQDHVRGVWSEHTHRDPARQVVADRAINGPSVRTLRDQHQVNPGRAAEPGEQPKQPCGLGTDRRLPAIRSSPRFTAVGERGELVGDHRDRMQPSVTRRSS